MVKEELVFLRWVRTEQVYKTKRGKLVQKKKIKDTMANRGPGSGPMGRGNDMEWSQRQRKRLALNMGEKDITTQCLWQRKQARMAPYRKGGVSTWNREGTKQRLC